MQLYEVIESGQPFDAVMYHCDNVNFNTRSTIICRPGEQAVFVRNGSIYEVISGGNQRVSTSLIPLIRKFGAMFSAGKDMYTADIYFVRTNLSSPMRWGNQITCQDPVYKIMAAMGVSGTYTYRVDDAALFLTEIFGAARTQISSDTINDFFRDLVRQETASAILDCVVNSGTDLLNIQMHLPKVAEYARQKVDANARRKGIAITDLTISQMTFVDSRVRDRLEEMKLATLAPDNYSRMRELDALDKLVSNENLGNMMPGMLLGGMMSNGQGGIGAVFGNAFGGTTTAPTTATSMNSAPVQPGSQSSSSSDRFCPQCGAPKMPGSVFCSKCGTRL